MSSKREEERNEKIIRGLMKLPPIGDALTATACREFTHRVKSVSMAKFTFQEVDALQKGGNQFWNAFDDSAGGQPTQHVLKINGQTAVHCTSDADKSLGFGVYEASNNDGTVRTADVGEPPSSSLSSDFSMALNDFPMVAAVSQFWKMSSLQAALPSTQMPTSYVGVAEESWFPQNSVSSYVPGGVPFDPTSGTFSFSHPLVEDNSFFLLSILKHAFVLQALWDS
ncbi:UNVERIFIED_CONTAM: putative ADP-ribosylation factor GTPase-activating protein AGD14 [Sesamum angustifolium]|uniref:ADP-ribosylation factor GTPase-activating protein AGD14 n=1 Tax=Sesamum angustifolium TaxID=2727405 RepID=A0AAW2PW41_9LAMI